MNSSGCVFGSFEQKQLVFICLCECRCMLTGRVAWLCLTAVHPNASAVYLHTHFTTKTLDCFPNISHLNGLKTLRPWVYYVSAGFRYPPSSRQTSHEEGKEWLRSHSTGGLQDTGSQSPLSPPGASCTSTGKYHYSNLRKALQL